MDYGLIGGKLDTVIPKIFTRCWQIIHMIYVL